MDTSRNVTVSMFETTIRIIGGLLAAYDLADDALLLARARALADKVLINFRVTGRGTPRTFLLIQLSTISIRAVACIFVRLTPYCIVATGAWWKVLIISPTCSHCCATCRLAL